MSAVFYHLRSLSMRLSSPPIRTGPPNLCGVHSASDLASVDGRDLFDTSTMGVAADLGTLTCVRSKALVIVPIPIIISSRTMFRSTDTLVGFRVFREGPSGSLRRCLGRGHAKTHLLQQLLLARASRSETTCLHPRIVRSIACLSLQGPLFEPIGTALGCSGGARSSICISIVLTFGSTVGAGVAVGAVRVAFDSSIDEGRNTFLSFKLVGVRPVDIRIPRRVEPRSAFADVFVTRLVPDDLGHFSAKKRGVRISSLVRALRDNRVGLRFRDSIGLSRLFLRRRSEKLVISLGYELTIV